MLYPLFCRTTAYQPDVAIGHSWSEDGFQWYVSENAAANSTIATTNDGWGGALVHGKRERPHVYYEGGVLRAFVSGVGLVPFCNPMNTAKYNASAPCSSGTQYGFIDSNSPDGWYDATYTLVQETL